MTALELRNLIYEHLHAELVAKVDEPRAYVGLQGEDIIVFVPNGQHLGVRVVAVAAEVAS